MSRLQGRAALPVTLVLGMSVSVAALRHVLPVQAADVLRPREFRLVQACPLHSSKSNPMLLSGGVLLAPHD